MLQHPIPVRRARLPWYMRLSRQSLAGLWRRDGNLRSKVPVRLAEQLFGRPQ